MKTTFVLAFISLTAWAGLSVTLPLKPAASPAPRPAQRELVQWMSMEEAVAAMKTERKKIFVDVYTDWCGWCKRMDNTFNAPEVAKHLNAHFYPVKLNAEQRDPIEIEGRTYKYVRSGNRGYNELAAELMNGRMSYPTTVFVDEEFNVIQPIPGFMEADIFEKVVRYFGEDHYKRVPWESYERQYQRQ